MGAALSAVVNGWGSSAAAAFRSRSTRQRLRTPRPRTSTHPTYTPALTALLHGDTFFLDNFAVRQWDDPNYSGTRIDFDKAEFVARVHELFKAGGCKLVDGYAPFCKHGEGRGAGARGGDAPAGQGGLPGATIGQEAAAAGAWTGRTPESHHRPTKPRPRAARHRNPRRPPPVFVPNFVGAKLGALEITPANRSLLRSAYTRRRPEELAVLTRCVRACALVRAYVSMRVCVRVCIHPQHHNSTHTYRPTHEQHTQRAQPPGGSPRRRCSPCPPRPTWT